MPLTQLVLGLAAGYHFGDVRPFLTSLRGSGYDGRCVLFVSETTRDIPSMEAAGAEVVRLERPDGAESVPYNGLRYFLYLDFLKANPAAERILLSDVRDVVFQADPFAARWTPGLHCALEDASMTIGKCPYNSHWMRGHLGQETLDRFGDRTISCSGTTWGDRAAVLEYLELLTRRLLPVPTTDAMAGYDQAVHNTLVHSDVLSRVTLHDNYDPVVTLGYVQGEPALDRDGCVVSSQGRRPVVVHQYDRKPTLFKHLRAKFA